MALINCPECGRGISKMAKACPHCGFPITDFEANSRTEQNQSSDAALGGRTTAPTDIETEKVSREDAGNVRVSLADIDGVEPDLKEAILESINKHKKKPKVGIFIFALLCGVIVFSCIWGKYNETKKRNAVINRITEHCERKSLSNVKVSLSDYIPQGVNVGNYTFCKVDISCDGFSKLDDSEKLRFYRFVDDSDTVSEKILIIKSDITITSDNHFYSWGVKGLYCDDSLLVESQDEPYTGNSSSSGSSTDSSDSSDSGARHSNAEAFTVAQAIVESDLKSPSTAKFCKVTEATITNSGDKYTVKGWVDAQNGFGAVVRKNFTVTYTATPKGYKSGLAVFY